MLLLKLRVLGLAGCCAPECSHCRAASGATRRRRRRDGGDGGGGGQGGEGGGGGARGRAPTDQSGWVNLGGGGTVVTAPDDPAASRSNAGLFGSRSREHLVYASADVYGRCV